MAYFLVQETYSEWPIFLRRIHDPPVGSQRAYTQSLEGVRKDLERVFGVLQAWLKVLCREGKLWCV